MDQKLFLSTFALIFLAELPDKTIFATIILATRSRPMAVFIGVAAAFLVQSLVAVTFGSAFALLPSRVVRVVAALSFFVFAWIVWRKKEDAEEGEVKTGAKGMTFLGSVSSAFVVIFLAEWGDLTQLATAALVAKYNNPITIFLAATSALWAVTAIAIVVGNRMSRVLKPALLQKVSAIAFVVVGCVLLFGIFR